MTDLAKTYLGKSGMSNPTLLFSMICGAGIVTKKGADVTLFKKNETAGAWDVTRPAPENLFFKKGF